MAEFQASETPEPMLDAIERGETVIIRRDGRTVARVFPEISPTEAEIARAFQALDDLRRERRGIVDVTIEEAIGWRHEGHKY
jgi:antitoxin (DNA-binding transcriptional repressor) of toxin-antitoxin stability system